MNEPFPSIPNISVSDELSLLSKSILKALVYFDIFNHPLTIKEVSECCADKTCTIFDIQRELKELQLKGVIRKKDKYFFLSDEKIIERRSAGEAFSKKYFRIAHRFSKLIAQFPFVRAVCISGSLSKNYMDKESDIDFFVITEPGRLWVARTFLVAFKKIFLLNSHKYFCVNYFVDTDNLEIPDKNIFTATELVHIIPVCNYTLYAALMAQNEWTKNFYPNFPLRENEGEQRGGNFWIKNIFEKILRGKPGEWLDEKFFRITLKRWKKKFSYFDESTFDLNMRTRKNVSKHHPLGFQGKVLNMYAERISGFEKKFDLSLSS